MSVPACGLQAVSEGSELPWGRLEPSGAAQGCLGGTHAKATGTRTPGLMFLKDTI